MRNAGKMTLVQVLVVVFVTLAAVTVGGVVLRKCQQSTRSSICMSNLSSINKGMILYKSGCSDAPPWISDRIGGWDTTRVGTNRNVDPRGPNDDPNNPRPRSITAVMFMLVRSGERPEIFRCPSDMDAEVDDNAKAGRRDGDANAGEYYWDFSRPENVSYSWQAPLRKDDNTWGQGINQGETDMVVVADMTPRYEGSGKWTPIPIDDNTSESDIRTQMSNNHGGRHVNVLKVAGYVKAYKRPDVGVAKDNIYTAYGRDFAKRRSATSINLEDHVHKKDTFLIGPVGRSE